MSKTVLWQCSGCSAGHSENRYAKKELCRECSDPVHWCGKDLCKQSDPPLFCYLCVSRDTTRPQPANTVPTIVNRPLSRNDCSCESRFCPYTFRLSKARQNLYASAPPSRVEHSENIDWNGYYDPGKRKWVKNIYFATVDTDN